MLVDLTWTTLVVAHLACQVTALALTASANSELPKRDEQQQDKPPLIPTWPGKPYVTFILTDKDTGGMGRNTKVLDIANCRTVPLNETKLHWTNLKGDAGSADARAACQTGLLFPVPSVDPKENIFSITVWDGQIGGYRAWQSDADPGRTLFVGGGFDPYWQEAQQFKLTCKTGADDTYMGKECQIYSVSTKTCLIATMNPADADIGSGPLAWEDCEKHDRYMLFNLRRQGENFSQNDHSFSYL